MKSDRHADISEFIDIRAAGNHFIPAAHYIEDSCNAKDAVFNTIHIKDCVPLLSIFFYYIHVPGRYCVGSPSR